MSRLIRPFAVVIALIAASSAARADIVTFSGGGSSIHPSSFTGSLEVKNQTTTSAVIEVKLRNTSTNAFAANASKGFITGFGFNNPGTAAKGNITGVTSLTYTPGNVFQVVSGSNADLGSQFGQFDFGASVGSTLHTSGTASNGVSVSEGLVTFTFVVSGTNLQNLSAAGLMTEMSANASMPNPFSVRFRGYSFSLYGGDGDKVPVSTINFPPPPPPPGAVPAPPAIILAGMGFGCMLLGRLRRKSAVQA
jgi:hypothetical protein